MTISAISSHVLPTPASTPPPFSHKKCKSYTTLQKEITASPQRRNSFSCTIEAELKAKKLKKKSTPSFANLLRAAGFGKSRDVSQGIFCQLNLTN
jgi:hypothetical protein